MNKKLLASLLLILFILGGVWLGRDYLKQFPLFSSLFTLGNPAEEVSETGLLRHFSMRTTGATTVIDETATANATLSGAIPKPGAIGQALDFDGTDDYIDAGADFISTDALTISAWIYLDSWGQGGGTARIIENGKAIMFVNSPNNGLYFYSDGVVGALAANNALSLSQWYHVAVTRTSANPSLTNFYINGVLSGTANQSSGTPTAGTTNVIIGNNNAHTRTFDGRIDELRLYNRVLTSAEITELYSQGNRTPSTGGINKGLVAHYSLAQEDLFSASVINDLTPNGRDGTITAGASAGFVADPTGASARAYDFNSNTSINAGSDFIGTQATSVSLWFKVDVENDNDYILNNGKFQIVYYQNFNRINFSQDGGTLTSGTAWEITVGSWYHLVITRNAAGTTTRYINGVSAPLGGTNGSPTAGTTNVTIGSGWDGAISDLRIYNRVISSAEVANLYQSYHPQGSTGSLEKGLIAHYPLGTTEEKLGSELVTNGGFEGTYNTSGTLSIANGWASHDMDTGVDTAAEETTIVHGGTSSQKIIADGNAEGVKMVTPSLTVGKRYRAVVWLYTAQAGKSAYFQLYDGTSIFGGSAGLTASQWNQRTFDFTATNTGGELGYFRMISDIALTMYIDDASIKEIKTADTTPSARHGSLYQDSTIYGTDQKSVANGAMDFNGTSDTVSAGADFISTGGDSVSAWVYLDSLGPASAGRIIDNNKLILNTVPGASSGYRIRFRSDGGGGGAYTSDGSINFSQWHHIVATRTAAGTANIYIDGVLSGTADQASGTPAAGSTVYLGNNANNDGDFDGRIADLRLYNRVLTAEEIKLLYDQKE